jgi:hypothetical protein
MRLVKCALVCFLHAVTNTGVIAQTGFVALPSAPTAHSAYISCNPTGDYGLSDSKKPNEADHDTCAVSSEELLKSPTYAPIDGFRLVGVMVSDVEIPKPEGGSRPDVAVLTDAIWRNKENTECILGTHLQMKDAPLANGKYLEVNDIARAGFAGKEISVAYFHKQPHAEIGGSAEVLFRAGRTFTSVKTTPSNKQLPSIKDAPAVNTAISDKNAASFSENWVDFTTDVSFKDTDGVTREHSSIFYTKYPCDAQDPVPKSGAIRLRTTGQSGLEPKEISVSGLVPIEGAVDKF